MNLLNVILSVCITSIMSYFSILNISNQKKDKRVFVIYLLIFIPLLTLNCIYFEDIKKLFLTIIFTITVLYLTIFKKDISNSVFYAFVYEMLAFISEFIISILILIIFKLNGISYFNMPFSLLISSILNCSLVYLLSKINFLSENIRKLNDIIKKNNKEWIYIFLVMILMVIKGYINKPERLSEYLDEVIGEHKTGQNYTVKQLGFLPDGGVKGLLYHKLSKMEDNNIKYYLYVDQNLKDKDIENFDLKTYRDLTKLLGVFLDNAIDAALKSEEKEIEVELKDKDDCLLLTISNTYDKNMDINKVGKSGFTTKGVGHGFGLSIVKDIAKTNSEIETFSSKENDKFIQTAMVYYKK